MDISLHKILLCMKITCLPFSQSRGRFYYIILMHRSEFLNALSSVEAILIRATLSDRMSTTYLRNVIMDTAVQSQTGQPRALEVEQCQCRAQYAGLSCQVNFS